MSGRVAVVTGSNKGLGLAIVQALCQEFTGVVYLTARDEDRGRAAVEKLKSSLTRPPLFHQLDVSDRSSVQRFREHLELQHGGIDILVNNAAVANTRGLYDDYEVTKIILDVNYRGLLIVEEELYPLVRDGGRILNISSDCGHLSNLRNKYWIERLSRKDITVEDIAEFVSWHEGNVQAGTFNKEDFADEGTVVAYRVSKIAVSALTMLQQKRLSTRGISVNSLHPGLVRTDMSSDVGFLSAEQAAETPLKVLLAEDPPQGAYIWYDGREVDWYDHKADWYFKISSWLERR